MVESAFPQEPLATASTLFETEAAVVAGLGLHALKQPRAQTVMEEAVQVVAQTLGNDLCKVLELLPDKKALLLRAGVGWQPGLLGQGTVSAGLESQAGYTLMEGGPVVVEDMTIEARFSGPPLLHKHQVVSGLSTPIYTSKGPWGVIGVHSTKPCRYTHQDRSFLMAVANVLGAAIEREHYEQELEAARQRLQQWDQMRARFLHNVAHELRTPLTPLLMQLQALDRLRESMDPQTRTGVRVAYRSAQRLQEMVEDFVELTKFQSNTVLLQRTDLDLAAVAQAAVVLHELQAKKKAIALTIEAEQAWVLGDQETLRRAMAVLIDNGVKFTPEGGSVQVAVEKRGDFAVFSVQDDGMGLAPEQMQMLFQPFVQVAPLEVSAGGLGVGLAIAKEIVELHGGRISAESAGPMQGARFWFMIRLAKGRRWTDQMPTA